MIIQKKTGHISAFDTGTRWVDTLLLDWHETSKRILHKRTTGGRELSIRFLNERPQWTVGDIVFADEDSVIVVDIEPCDAIIVVPDSPYRLASLCYEIGNKHLPLFMDGAVILIPYDEPLFRLLTAGGYAPERAVRKLLYPLQSTVSPHAHEGGQGLLSRILKLTSSNNG